MALTRKKYIIDKNFQYKISFKAILFPLCTVLIISAFLLYFADKNNQLIKMSNTHIDEIINTQDSMIDMFLSTPSLQYSKNSVTREGISTFKQNIGKLKKIKDTSRNITHNSIIFFYILIGMTIIQTIVIFSIFIILSHRISGPVQVMTGYLKEIKEGSMPAFRPLRKKDELKPFYDELRNAITFIHEKSKKDS